MTQETDRELLELAAKVAEFGYQWDDDVFCVFDCGFWHEWNPLTDDGDAFRLAVKLNLFFKHSFADALAEENDVCNGDYYLATRRAIVRVAAEIGKAM